MMCLVALSGIRLLFYMEVSGLEYARDLLNTFQTVSHWVPDIRSVGVVVLEEKSGDTHITSLAQSSKGASRCDFSCSAPSR
jgi:hypothetical protein